MTLWALPLLPAAGAAVVAALTRARRTQLTVAVAVLLTTLAVAVWASAAEPTATLRWGPLLGLHLAADGFGRVMTILVPTVATPIVVYAATTEVDGRSRLLALMVAFVGVMELLVSAADFLTLLIAWELVGALSWALIGHGWREADNPRAAAQAFVTTRLGDLGLYIAAGVTFAATGSFAFGTLHTAGQWQLSVVAAGVLVAAAAKSAQVPFSPWLFSAMAGPTPVSALLHSATMVAAGAYLLIRLAPQLGAVGWFEPVVAAVGLATALAGGLVALTQTQLKRVLAASTSAQFGLMFLAIGSGSAAAAGAQLVTHAAFKSLLFLGAGIALHAAGTAELGQLRLGRLVPAVAALSGVGAAALAAVPPLGGAWSKEQIVAAAMDASGWTAAGVVVAGVLTALYAARYQVLAYGPARDDSRRQAPYQPSPSELAGPCVLAAITVGLSVLWLPGAGGVVERAVGGGLATAGLAEQAASVALVAAAIAAAVVLARRDRLVTLGLPVGARAFAAGWLGLATAARRVVVDPVLSLSRLLARLDDRVIDAGVRAAVWLAGQFSRLLSLRIEWSIDGAVHGTAGAVLQAAAGSRVTDERAVDGAVRAVAALTMAAAAGSRVTDDRAVDGVLVEGTAAGVGALGRTSRRLQTGLSHHYYLVVAGGLAAAAVVLAAWR